MYTRNEKKSDKTNSASEQANKQGSKRVNMRVRDGGMDVVTDSESEGKEMEGGNNDREGREKMERKKLSK